MSAHDLVDQHAVFMVDEVVQFSIEPSGSGHFSFMLGPSGPFKSRWPR
jgi:hypothetical protein